MGFAGGGSGDRVLAQMQADDLNNPQGRGPKWDRKVWLKLALALTPFVVLTIIAAIVS